MASSRDALADLELSRDEVERIGKALKDKEFRKLLVDYVEEIQDPANRKIYEEEITQLERERGIDVTFINPVAGYVIKTSADGSSKCFINVCANENVEKPTSSPECEEGVRGLRWSLPHILSPPRDDMDNKGAKCRVFDVCFHPNTLHLAQKNKAFRRMVNGTACDAVEKNFNVRLDRKNLRFPKMQYKGMPHASIIRKPSGEKPIERDAEEQKFYDQLYAQVDEKYSRAAAANKSPKKSKQPSRGNAEDPDPDYTTPKYLIKHRTHVELEDFAEHRHAKMNSATPKELVVEIDLPLLKSAGDIALDVTSKTVQLVSERPAKYKLFLALPYEIDQDSGSAKFDKDAKRLVLTLPVRRCSFLDYARDDSGVESDHNPSPVSSSPAVDDEDGGAFGRDANASDARTKAAGGFLEDFLRYTLPEHTCHRLENTLAFTLHVKNVEESSIDTLCTGDAVHLKFTSVSSGFYPVHHAIYVRFKADVDPSGVSVETWDNNVILQVTLENAVEPINSYFVGLDDAGVVEKFIEEPFILNGVLKARTSDDEKEEIHETEATKRETPAELGKETENKKEINITPATEYKSKAIDIAGTYSESSGDELSSSFSPSKSKGILKRLAKSRGSVSRSVSESSIDDYVFASSLENCHTSLDSVIPEDGEVSTSLKKTVRFNDVVSRQLYRSNSSILGQKKKNQRKAKNKKRALERRHSESEASEVEDKKEGEEKTYENKIGATVIQQASDEEGKDLQDIFDFDVI